MGAEASVAWRRGRDTHGHRSQRGIPGAETGAQGLSRNLIERTSEEELEEREIPGCVLKVVEFATTATFGKFLAQHSAFMRMRGIAYSKKHTSAGQIITLERVVSKGSEGNEGCRRV